MTTHMIGTRKEWLAARFELLEAEKELTRRSDELARRHQELPWVRIDKNYRFETKVAAMTGTDVATYTRERPGMSAGERKQKLLKFLKFRDVAFWRPNCI